MSSSRVLIVYDSPTMRSLISAVLRRDPEIEVVGVAGDPLEARAAIKALEPDVLTLDIEMPNMNGLEFLEKIMRLRPMPVVMVSTLTQKGADATLQALEIGAVDCVGKPGPGADVASAFEELAEKVKTAAKARVRPAGLAARGGAQAHRFSPNGRIVAIGSSTGGVEALLTVLSRFPANCPPTVITQHMPAAFTRSFAERLNRSSAAEVQEAYDGAPLQQGRVYLAPGGLAHLEVVGANNPRCALRDGEPVNGHRPSVDRLFSSLAHAVAGGAVGVILTGMGRDGARGLKEMRDLGGHTLGQDEQSCVVYGMPKAAADLGAVERQTSLERMGDAILDLCNLEQRERA
ncbi:MAG: chemotaxis response regulator protein-glutamate methylesterase [Caulobacteraceae bacterium]|nr:chemotaxis response regulator protein-glutamate methylesterase [Caulobacteraceae bacterium]